MKKLCLLLFLFNSLFSLYGQNKKKLNASILRLKSDSTLMSNTIEEKKIIISKNTTEIERMKTDSISTQNRLSNKSKDLEEKTIEANKLNKYIIDLENEINTLKLSVSNKEIAFNNLETKNLEKQKTIDEKNQIINKEKLMIDSLNLLIAEFKAIINLNDKTINELKSLSDNQKNEMAIMKKKAQEENIEGTFINPGALGALNIGDKINLNSHNYKVKKTDWEDERGEVMGFVYEYSKIDFYLLGNDMIESIEINSNEYKTLKGIGVGSTIKEFTETYSVIRIWCEYDTGLVLETEELRNIWFHTNHSIDKIDSDWSNIEIKELDLNKEITYIKIF